MHGTAWNRFLTALVENETLRAEVIEVAARHGIDFASDQLSDNDLDGVAG